jgi:antitoxin VapB
MCSVYKISTMNKTIIVKKEKGKISIPDDMELDDDKFYLKKVGNTLYVIPFHDPWQGLIDCVNDFSEDYMNERNQPETEIREKL